MEDIDKCLGHLWSLEIELKRKLTMLREQYKAVEDGRLESFAGVVVSERLKARGALGALAVAEEK